MLSHSAIRIGEFTLARQSQSTFLLRLINRVEGSLSDPFGDCLLVMKMLKKSVHFITKILVLARTCPIH